MQVMRWKVWEHKRTGWLVLVMMVVMTLVWRIRRML